MGGVKWMSQIKAIGFDVDGTLYHSPDELQLAIGGMVIVEAARCLGKQPDEIKEEYIRRRGELRSNTMTLNSFGLPGEEIFGKIWRSVRIEKCVKRDERLRRLLRKLKARYRLFMISNGRGLEIEKKLKCLGVDSTWFDPLVACYDHGWVKPEPAPFLAALESLGLVPGEVVYVGDREDVDVEAAKMVGMRAILIGGESEEADACCERVYDIEQLFFPA